MVTTAPNCDGELGTPAKTICAQLKDLKEKLSASESSQIASASKVTGWETARGYKLCTLKVTEKTFRYYRDLDNYELFDIQESAGIIADNVTRYSKWDDDLTKHIKDASKMLNDLKAKMLDANNASCAMRNCLQSIIGFDDDHVPDALKEVLASAKSLSEDSQKAADAIATIAGIHTFADLKPLKQFAQDLFDAVKNLRGVTDGLIKTAGDDVKSVQADLTKVIDELNTEMFESAKQYSVINGLNSSIDFVCGCECLPVDQLEQICVSVSKGEDAAENDERRSGQARGDQD